MGDMNGVCVAQEFHRNLLLQNGVMRPDEEIILGKPFPDKSAIAGVCIDDLAIVQKLKPNQARAGSKLRDNAILDQADAVCGAHHLPENVGKRQRLLPGGRAWGAFLSDRADSGIEKTSEIMRLTLASVLSGFLTKREGQRLIGHLNYPLQFRRPLYCMLSSVYTWLESLPEPEAGSEHSHRIPVEAKDEL
jgi:hypothetical protein